jgi:trk system potassium uptake protein TrkA
MRRRLFAVIGLGRFGSAVASTLVQLGQDVIGVDSDAERVREIGELTRNALQLDATDSRALREAGIAEADVAIISIGENIESSVLVVMQVKDLGVPEVVAKAVTALHGRILEKLGVTRVIFPDRDMAERTARSLVIPNALDYVALSAEHSMVEVPAPGGFIGRSLRAIELRPRFGLMLLAIKRPDANGQIQTLVAPSADEIVRPGDVLTLLGSNDRVAEIDKLPKG